MLKMRFNPHYVIDLEPVGDDVFFYTEGWSMQVTFTRDETGAPVHAEVRFDDDDPGGTLIRETTVPWRPSKNELAEFAGRYRSDHLDFDWTTLLDESGRLIIRRSTTADTIAEPDGKDQFHLRLESYPGIAFDAWMLFHRDSEQRITHFTVWARRLMHHRFDRVEACAPIERPHESGR